MNQTFEKTHGDPAKVQFRTGVSVQPIDKLSQAKALMGDQYWLFVLLTIVALILGAIVPMAILLGPMLCGLFFCFHIRYNGQRASFETLFKGFDWFLESLIATLIMIGLMLVALVPLTIAFVIAFGAAVASDNAPFIIMTAVGFYASIFLISMFFYVPFIFTYILIVEESLTGWEAIKLSARASKANIGSVIKLVLVYTVLSILATFVCYLPVFLLAPLIYGGVYLFYHDVFPSKANIVVT